MKLVDQWGRPFKSDALDEPQTSVRASLAHLHRHIDGHPSRGLTPARLNAILEAAEQGDLMAQHELFTDMEERDGHVFSELSKRKRASVKLPWDVVPPRNASDEEKKLAAWAREQLLDLPDFEDMLLDLLDGISHGFAALELEWLYSGGMWTIGRADHRPQTWFQMDRETRTQIRLRDNSADGEPLRPFGWILHVHKSISGYIGRAGLGRVLSWPYLFKHFSVGDLAEFLDIHGLPLIIGKYPSGANDDERATLFRAVAGIGHNARGIIPDGMLIEMKQASDAKGDPFMLMINWCERAQSKAINGSTLTSEAGATGLGSGLAEVHNEVRLDIRDADCKQLAGTVTRNVIYPLLAVNKGWRDARRCPRFVFDTAVAEDIKLYADSLPKLAAVGLRIPVSWAHEKLRIPQPEGDKDPVLVPLDAEQHASSPSKPPAQAEMRQQFMAALATATAENDDDALPGPQPDLTGLQTLDEVVAALELSPDIDRQTAALMAPYVQAVMSAKTFEGMQAALDAAITDVDVTPLADALHRVGFAAHWLGAGDAD